MAALEKCCYPASLRLQNSLGTGTHACTVTRVNGGELVCVHNSRNGKYVEQGLPPRFACFLPFNTACIWTHNPLSHCCCVPTILSYTVCATPATAC